MAGVTALTGRPVGCGPPFVGTTLPRAGRGGVAIRLTHA